MVTVFCAGTVRIYLQSWVKAKDRAMVQRLKEERATIHYSNNLLTSAIRQWQLHHSTAIRKQVTGFSRTVKLKPGR